MDEEIYLNLILEDNSYFDGVIYNTFTPLSSGIGDISVAVGVNKDAKNQSKKLAPVKIMMRPVVFFLSMMFGIKLLNINFFLYDIVWSFLYFFINFTDIFSNYSYRN